MHETYESLSCGDVSDRYVNTHLASHDKYVLKV